MCDLQSLSYVLSIEPYLNTYSKQYQSIITIDKMPTGPLSQMVSRYSSQKLSQFQVSSNDNNCCKYAFLRIGGNRENYFLTAEDVPSLLGYISANGYTIDTSITKIVQKANIGFTNKKIVCIIKNSNV